MRLITDATCRFCGEMDESAEHLLCNCEALASSRFKHFKSGFLEPVDLRLFNIQTIEKYFQKLSEKIWET